MNDVPEHKGNLLLAWLSPTLGAICFGGLMYAGMALGDRHRQVLAGIFLLLGIAAVVATRRLTKPYTPPAFGFYIFAGGCIFFGALGLIVRM